MSQSKTSFQAEAQIGGDCFKKRSVIVYDNFKRNTEIARVGIEKANGIKIAKENAIYSDII
ncbi:hypothetical protein IH785_17070 [candidate division KSB1 bacterium]|nr:hypothetical protein [candidate division KSB1 bacterium]